MPMKYNIEERAHSVIITFEGNVMGGPEAAELNDQLHELIDRNNVNIVAELGKVEFMNSSGLGMLIGGLTTMRKAGGDLRLANMSAKIEKLLNITKLNTVFKHFETTDEAVASYIK